jgi:proteic killer suppression protein
VIAGLRDADAELLWLTGKSQRIPAALRKVVFRKLAILNAALEPANLLVPPGNRLEKLTGDRSGQYSIWR